jgi:hypothetical protein
MWKRLAADRDQWNGDENLGPVYKKKPFFEILSGFFYF